jgi:hypothetical protein
MPLILLKSWDAIDNSRNQGNFTSFGDRKTIRYVSAGSFLLRQWLVDKPWEEGAIKIIRKAQVPVVPIYFHLMFFVIRCWGYGLASGRR